MDRDISLDWCSGNPLCAMKPFIARMAYSEEPVTAGCILLHKINGDQAQLLTDTAHRHCSQ